MDPARRITVCLCREERARCYGGRVLYVVGIVQWYHPRPLRRAAGVRCPERSGLWRPAVGGSRLVVDVYLHSI